MSDKQTILVVDDTPENIELLVNILKDRYQVKAATSGALALKLVTRSPPDLILLDVMMPEMDGYEVCQKLKADYTTKHIPVIFITAKVGVAEEVKGLDLGAVDYIIKPISPPIVNARVKTHIALHNQNKELEKQVQKRTELLNDTRIQVIRRLGRAAEYRDEETGLHVIRISHYARILGLAAGMSDEQAEVLFNAAPMHDIGKIGIPDYILQKSEKLTDEEFEIQKMHCEIGAEIIGDDPSEMFQMAKSIALSHHEKWDGSGYPRGLKEDEIPRVGRIVAIADVFDAVTSKRPYKDAWPVEKAVEVLKSSAGKHLDPQLVSIFLSCLPQIMEIRARYSD